MSDDSLTLRVLTDIRDELRETNKRLDQTRIELKVEISQTRVELSQTIVELKGELGQTRRELRSEIVEVELRLATRFTELIAATRDTHSLLVDRFDLRDRMDRCERDIEELKKQVG